MKKKITKKILFALGLTLVSSFTINAFASSDKVIAECAIVGGKTLSGNMYEELEIKESQRARGEFHDEIYNLRGESLYHIDYHGLRFDLYMHKKSDISLRIEDFIVSGVKQVNASVLRQGNYINISCERKM